MIEINKRAMTAVVTDATAAAEFGIPSSLSPRDLYLALATNPSTRRFPLFTTANWSQSVVEKTGASRFANKAVEMWHTVTGPTVTQEVLEHRASICRTCIHRKESDGKSYCGACGCPNWSIAELETKLAYARLACPVGLFHAVNEETERHLLADDGILDRAIGLVKGIFNGND